LYSICPAPSRHITTRASPATPRANGSPSGGFCKRHNLKCSHSKSLSRFTGVRHFHRRRYQSTLAPSKINAGKRLIYLERSRFGRFLASTRFQIEQSEGHVAILLNLEYHDPTRPKHEPPQPAGKTRHRSWEYSIGGGWRQTRSLAPAVSRLLWFPVSKPA